MSEVLYRADRLSKGYGPPTGTIPALIEVSFTVRSGSFTAITGPSGSGKSTLLNLMGFLDKEYAGSLSFGGRDLYTLTGTELAKLRNQKIGFVFQSFQLLPLSSARENVELPLLYSDTSSKARRDRADEALMKVGLAHRATHMPSQLSGGEQQRVAIARAVVNNPKVILADEPTGSLDSVTGDAIMRLLTNLNAQGTSVIVVTHSNEVASRATEQIVLKDGRVDQKGHD
jgi:putative ABC transport system ATP-binding protein